METFYVRQAIEIEQAEIEMMKIRVEAEGSKARLSVPAPKRQQEIIRNDGYRPSNGVEVSKEVH